MVSRSKGEDKSSLIETKQKTNTPALNYLQDVQKQEDDLYLLTSAEQQVQGVLGALQRIRELLETHKNVAPVEDLRQKILAEYKKIRQLLNPDNTAEQSQKLENGRQSLGGIEIEQNPLIRELGGMPLDEVSPEWRELTESNLLDKTELENLVNKKLKEKVDLANKLKLQNRLKASPKMSPGKSLTPKYQEAKRILKYVLKDLPPPPRPAPTSLPRPRPPGM